MHSYSHNRMRNHSHHACLAVSLHDSTKGVETSSCTAKSSSIAIKRARPGSMRREYKDPMDSTEYDMATWRMYHRIVNHRTSRQEAVESAEDIKSDTTSDCAFPTYHSTFVNCTKICPDQFSEQDLDGIISEMEEDEAIFQLDL
jgi:hypothetical protein